MEYITSRNFAQDLSEVADELQDSAPKLRVSGAMPAALVSLRWEKPQISSASNATPVRKSGGPLANGAAGLISAASAPWEFNLAFHDSDLEHQFGSPAH